jgi:16S rRNA (uracil1498-N3)-methyltransferase
MNRPEPRPRRFFSPDSIGGCADIKLSVDAAHHAIRVLRLNTGDAIRLFDTSGVERDATITHIEKQDVQVALGNTVEHVVESPLDLTLAIAIIRGERMDFIVQKATELGVTRIAPLATERGIIRLSTDKKASRLRHWQSVAQSACEQCGRRIPPQMDPIVDIANFTSQPFHGRKLVLNPHGESEFDGNNQNHEEPVMLLIGPEGGLTPREIEMSRTSGFESVMLGPRILRTETAAIAGVVLLQAMHGDLLKQKI